jgi:hypothetical protein
MANAIWDIAQLERKLPDGETCPDGAVYTAHYTVSLKQDGKTAGAYSSVGFGDPNFESFTPFTASAYGSVGFGDPNPESFTPFSELTKEEVLNWVFDTLGVDQVVAIEESLYQQIQQKVNPTTATGTPW